MDLDARALPNAPRDAFCKRKRKSKKNGEGTSNPPYSTAKKSKKTKTSRRIIRSIDTEDAEVQKRVTIKATIAIETAKAAKVVKAGKLGETYKVSKASITTDVEMIVEESSHLSKKAKQEYVETFTH